MIDDLLEESFLLLLPTVTEQVLTMDSVVQNHIIGSPGLSFAWQPVVDDAINQLITIPPVPYVGDIVQLSMNSVVQTMLSYQSLTTYDPILDEDGGTITDLSGDPVTSLAFLTDIQLIISYGITVANAINELLSTSPEFVLPDLIMTDGISQLPTSSPLLSRISNLLANNASQLQPTDQAYIARALLFSITNALQEQIATDITNITFEYPVSANNSLQEQISDAITASAAHGLVTGNSLNELKDDAVTLAGSLAALINDSLNTLTSDSIATNIVANLLGDNALNQITETSVLVHAVYALLVNSAIHEHVAGTVFLEQLLTIQDGLNNLTDISPTLTAIFSLLIDDSINSLLGDAQVHRAIAAALSDSLQDVTSDSVYFAQAFALALNDALQTIDTTSPNVTITGLVSLVREVLARGHYFFKAKDKLRR